MNKAKRKHLSHETPFLLLAFIFLILISSSGSANYFNFSESFGSNPFNLTLDSTDCSRYYDYSSLVASNGYNFSNNWKCLLTNSTGSAYSAVAPNKPNYKNVTSTSFINSKQGIEMDMCYSSSMRYIKEGLLYTFVDEVSLTALTNISYYCRTEEDIGNPELIFLAANGSRLLGLPLADTTCSSTIGNSTYCREVNITWGCTTEASKQKKSFLISDVLEDSTFNNNIQGIKSIGVLNSIDCFSVPTTDSLYFDDLTILNLLNGTNQLPQVNITSTKSCINGSQYGFVNFNFSAYDPEGDTIYYASNFNQGSNYNQSKKYSKDIFNIFNMFFVEIPDFSFMDQVINTGNTDCNINRDVNNYNSSALNLVNYFWFGINGFGGGRSPYMLELNSQCSKNNRLLYALPNNLIDVTYETRLFNFNDVNESFNISYYGPDNFLKARRIYYYNSSKDKIFVYNFENSITTKALEIDPVIDNRPLTLHNDLHSETGFKYVGLDYNGVMYQESFEITGTNNNLTWSTTLPYDLATAYAGDYKLRFYVSDSVHYPDEYTTIIKSERVLDCRYDTGSIKNVDSYIGCTGFDPLCFINVLLGKPFKNYMRVIDTDNLGQTIVWWAYIIMFIGLFIGEYLLTKTPDLIIPFFISSICIFFVSLLGGYIQSLTVSLILMAIVLGGLFTNLFKGGANG